MSKFTEFLINSLAPMISQIGQTKLIEVLQKLHDKNPEQYEATIRGGHTFIKPLVKLVADTKGKLDDGLVDAIDEAITISAESNGVIFSEEESKS